MYLTNLKFSILINLIFCFSNSYQVWACTTFMLKNQEQVIVGKNLDWPIGDGFIFINPKNIEKFSLVQNDDRYVQWKSKYGSVTFNQFGKAFPLGGMNEAGLVIEELSFSPSVHEPHDDRPVINEFQWVQYQLDNYASVQEVIQHISELRIKKLLFGLHYFISDSSGNSAVFEIINGKTNLYYNENLSVPVLSNNSYKNSIKYLQRYKGFGGDEEIIHGRSGSQTRFLYAADLIYRFNESQDKSLKAYGINILDKVKQDDTQWSIIYDPQNLEIWFHVQNRQEKNIIRLKDYGFGSEKISSILSNSLTQNNQLFFRPYSREQNKQLLNSVFSQLIRLDEINQAIADSIQKEIIQYLPGRVID